MIDRRSARSIEADREKYRFSLWQLRQCRRLGYVCDDSVVTLVLELCGALRAPRHDSDFVTCLAPFPGDARSKVTAADNELLHYESRPLRSKSQSIDSGDS